MSRVESRPPHGEPGRGMKDAGRTTAPLPLLRLGARSRTASRARPQGPAVFDSRPRHGEDRLMRANKLLVGFGVLVALTVAPRLTLTFGQSTSDAGRSHPVT